MLLEFPVRAMPVAMGLIVCAGLQRPALKDLVLFCQLLFGFRNSLRLSLIRSRLFRLWNRVGDGVEQVPDSQAMLATYRPYLATPQLAKVFRGRSHRLALDLVHGQKNGLVGAA